jgi:hypothetical protein
MGVRASQKHDLLRAGQLYVGHELAAAAQMAIILAAQQRRADAAFLTGALVRHLRPPLRLSANASANLFAGSMMRAASEDNRQSPASFVMVGASPGPLWRSAGQARG